MKATAVPTVCSFLSAITALLFFGGFARVYGDDLLGTAILISSAVSMVQIAVVPQAWVYVIGARSPEELAARFSAGTLAEIIGGLTGAATILFSLLLPIPVLREYGLDVLSIYGGLWIAGSTSPQGYLRASEHWLSYAGWMLLPNVLRVIFVFSVLWASGSGGITVLSPDQRHVAFFSCFLLPDVLGRLAFINARLMFRLFRVPPVPDFLIRLRSIRHNWLFDIGSALTEVADKVVVGAVLGPSTLIAYFFGRKVGAAATMVLEPYYVEQYRKLGNARPGGQTAIYARGVALAGTIYLLLLTAFAALSLLLGTSSLVPQAVWQNQGIFMLVLLIECGIAANRWTRYHSHVSGKSVQLLLFRSALCLVFVAEMFLFGRMWNGLGVCAAFFGLWLIETLYVNLLLRESVAARIVRFIGV